MKIRIPNPKNTPVSFPLSKLLKKKGYDEDCRYYYSGAFEPHHGGLIEFAYLQRNSKLLELQYSAPTIFDVVMWLYEKHGIWMFTDRTNNWFWTIQKSTGENIHQEDLPITEKFICDGFNSPTEAYEAAIEYTLNNLI